MPSFVPDASVTLPWCFEDERTAFTESLLNRIRISESVIVPGHWPVEILNSLIQAKKRGRVPEEKIRRFLQDLSSLITNEVSQDGSGSGIWPKLIGSRLMMRRIWSSHNGPASRWPRSTAISGKRLWLRVPHCWRKHDDPADLHLGPLNPPTHASAEVRDSS
jgi:hypothetical protein